MKNKKKRKRKDGNKDLESEECLNNANSDKSHHSETEEKAEKAPTLDEEYDGKDSKYRLDTKYFQLGK